MKPTLPASSGPSETRKKYISDLEWNNSKSELLSQECEKVDAEMILIRKRVRVIMQILRLTTAPEDKVNLSQEQSTLEETLRTKSEELERVYEMRYQLSQNLEKVHAQYQKSIWLTPEAISVISWFQRAVNKLQDTMEDNPSVWGWRRSTPAVRLTVDDFPEFTTY